MVNQCRYALSLHSSRNSGSPFLAEMKRMMSSLSPGGAASTPISVSNPHLYSRVASDSMLSAWVDIRTFSFHVSESIHISQDKHRWRTILDCQYAKEVRKYCEVIQKRTGAG